MSKQQYKPVIYKVKTGDNLSKIAQSHDLTLKQLLVIPGNEHFKSAPDHINPGDIVFLSGDQHHEGS